KPVDTAKSDIEWKISPSKGATVDADGNVTFEKTGKFTITATARKNKKATAKVVVNVSDRYLPTGITLDKKGTVTIDLTETLDLVATLAPTTAKSDIQWKTSSDKIATVTNGHVVPVKAGSVTITATETKKNKKATVKVVIKDMHAPKKISIEQGTKLTLDVGKSIDLTAKVEGESGYEPRKVLTWSTTDKNVTLDPATGTVTANAPGKAKITVATDNNKKASITITVPKP
ncbi:MAG: Ig-like domain-containing protein, partial [Clostridia bacterium]|nr:Ig-like domain-containing protein [Clostridia bacterium]